VGLRALDLFCGAGGITRGFLEAGFEVTGLDNSQYVEATFGINNHAAFEKTDLLREIVKQKCDVITGGPPCKPWASINVNMANRRLNHRDHRLVARFFRHVEENKPEMFLFENVPPLQYDVILARHKSKMEKLGYSVEARIVKYSDYGASTARRRLIVFGTKGGSAGTFFKMLEGKTQDASTVKDVIWDLRNFEMNEVADHVWPNLRTIRKYRKYYRTHKYGWYILEWDKPAPSFGNVMKTYILPPGGLDAKPLRVISVREAMSIMGFDRDFRFPDDIGIGQKYQMTVDSVSPVFSQAAAEVIRDMMNGKEGQ
jgi:DNA (cytosine-5)-methyltransferase 1